MVNLYNNPNDIFEEDENIIQIDQVLPPTMEGMPEGYENKLTTLNKALADRKYIMPGSPEFYRSASQFNDFFGKDVPNFISEKGFDKISASAALGSLGLKLIFPEGVGQTMRRGEVGEPVSFYDMGEAALTAFDVATLGTAALPKQVLKAPVNFYRFLTAKLKKSPDQAFEVMKKNPELVEEIDEGTNIEDLTPEQKDKLGVGAGVSPDTKNNKFFGSYYLDQDIDYTSPPKDPMGEKIKPTSIAINDAMASNPGDLSTAKELLEELGTDPDTVSINAAQKGDQRAADIAGAGKIKTIKNIRHDGNSSLYKKATQRKTDSEMERLASNPVIKKIFEKEKLIKSHALEQSAVKVLPGKFNTPRDFSIYEMIPQDLMATVKLGRLEDMDPTKPQVFSTQGRNMKHKAIGAAIVSNLIDKYKVLGYEFKPNKKNLGGSWTFNEELILPLPEKKKTLESINKNISTLEKQLKELKLETMFYDPTKDRLVFFGKGPESLTDLKKDVKKRGFAYGGQVTEDLDIFEAPEDSLPEGSYQTANLMLPLFKLFGKAPPHTTAPIPTPKEKLVNPTKKQKESLEAETIKRSTEDVFDPTPNDRINIEESITTTPITKQPMTSVFYSDVDRLLSRPDTPKTFNSKQEFFDFLNKNNIRKSESMDYRIPQILKLFGDTDPIDTATILTQVRTAPISGMRVHATGPGSELINPNGAVSVRYSGYAEDGFIEGSQRERILYMNRDKLPGDSGDYPQSMFGGEQVNRHEFQIPNEQDTYIVGWTRLTDRFGFVPPKVAGPETQINLRQLNKEISKNNRTIKGLYAEAQSKIERLANQRGMSQADISQIMDDFDTSNFARDDTKKLQLSLGTIAKYADQLDEISPGLVNQLDELVVRNRELNETVQKASGIDPSGVVRVTYADEIQSDILQAAAMRKQQLAAALRKIQEEGKQSTNLQGLNRVAEATINFFEENKSVFRPLEKSPEEMKLLNQQMLKLDEEVDNIVNKYIATRELDDAELAKLGTLLNDNIDKMLNEVMTIDGATMSGLFPDLPLKNREEWADALIKKDLYELAYRKYVLKDPNASDYYATATSNPVIERYGFNGNAATPKELRDIDKQERFDIFKRNGEFKSSKYKGIGMDEFYGGPNTVDEKGKHYTSTIEKILKKQAKENNSEVITMPVQVKKGSKAQYQVTDQNGNMVATLTNEDQARELMRTNPNYQIKPISIPDKKSMEPVFAIKITEEMLESFATHKAKGGLVSNIDIFEVA